MKGKYLLLGTNLGDQFKNLKEAKDLILRDVGIVIKASSIYQTAPWGIIDQPSFLNQVVRIKTNLSPLDLLYAVSDIEKEMGRKRFIRWDSRLIDIDILFYDNYTIESDMLTIPHPEIRNRRFTLVPMNEIASDELHPVLNKTIDKLLDETLDVLEVKKISAPDFIGLQQES
jgi:2-amino-4-hydroxy-6-hydroxymethyldihydropteridine diphosphokinase